MNLQFKPGLEKALEKVGRVFLEPTRPGPKRYYLYRVFTNYVSVSKILSIQLSNLYFPGIKYASNYDFETQSV
jgi:hypothetical protein